MKIKVFLTHALQYKKMQLYVSCIEIDTNDGEDLVVEDRGVTVRADSVGGALFIPWSNIAAIHRDFKDGTITKIDRLS